MLVDYTTTGSNVMKIWKVSKPKEFTIYVNNSWPLIGYHMWGLHGRRTLVLYFLGLTLIFGWAGNCIHNVLHIERGMRKDVVQFVITLRGKGMDETVMYIAKDRFDIHSEQFISWCRKHQNLPGVSYETEEPWDNGMAYQTGRFLFIEHSEIY
jgi:hypothetical protein